MIRRASQGTRVPWSLGRYRKRGDCRPNPVFTVMRKTSASPSITMTSTFVYEPRISPHVNWASRAGIAAFSATLLGWWVSFLFCGVPASHDGQLVDLTTFQCDVIPLQVSTGQFMRHSWCLPV